MSVRRRLALFALLWGALVAGDVVPLAMVRLEPRDETAICRALLPFVTEHRETELAPPPPEPEPPKKPAPKGPRASRGRLALFSAPPPEKPYCEPPPEWAVGLRETDFGMPDLNRIERYVRYFAESKKGRVVVEQWLRRSGKWRHVVTTALHANRMPLDLQALVFIESGFSPTAKSKAGAVGLWQLMPATAKGLGLRVDRELDERRSIYKATDAALRHLSELHATFGSWELVFAAYDYGAGRLLRRMQEHGAMDYWTLSAIDGALPLETVDYVPKLLAFAVILKNLERFGFDEVKLEKPIFTSELEVPGGTTFALLARAAATSIRYLRELNPEILGGRNVPSDESYAVNVPSSGLARARVMLRSLLSSSDGLEDTVSDEFDWAKGHVDHNPLVAVANTKKVRPSDRFAGFEEEAARIVALPRRPRELSLPTAPRSTATTNKSAAIAAPKPAKPLVSTDAKSSCRRERAQLIVMRAQRRLRSRRDMRRRTRPNRAWRPA